MTTSMIAALIIGTLGLSTFILSVLILITPVVNYDDGDLRLRRKRRRTCKQYNHYCKR